MVFRACAAAFKNRVAGSTRLNVTPPSGCGRPRAARGLRENSSGLTAETARVRAALQARQEELGEYQRENKGHAGGGGDCAAGDEREHATGAGTGGSCAEWIGTADESGRGDGTADDGGEPEYAAVYSGAQADRAAVLAGYGQGLHPPVPHVPESDQALDRK